MLGTTLPVGTSLRRHQERAASVLTRGGEPVSRPVMEFEPPMTVSLPSGARRAVDGLYTTRAHFVMPGAPSPGPAFGLESRFPPPGKAEIAHGEKMRLRLLADRRAVNTMAEQQPSKQRRVRSPSRDGSGSGSGGGGSIFDRLHAEAAEKQAMRRAHAAGTHGGARSRRARPASAPARPRRSHRGSVWPSAFHDEECGINR